MHFPFFTFLVAFPLSFAVVAASKDGPARLDSVGVEKRRMHCNNEYHNREGGGGCSINNKPTPVCNLLCINKSPHPEIKWLHQPAFAGVKCPNQDDLNKHLASDVTPVVNHYPDQTQTWSMPNTDRQGSSFSGTVTGDGSLEMSSSGESAFGYEYVVAFKVINWTYYYDLKAREGCQVNAPDAKDIYVGLKSVQVYQNGFSNK